MTGNQIRLMELIQMGAVPPAMTRDAVTMCFEQPGLLHPIRRWQWHRSAKRFLDWAGFDLVWSWRKLAYQPVKR